MSTASKLACMSSSKSRGEGGNLLAEVDLIEKEMIEMSVKQKGSKAERELLHMFWAKNWACLRSAGSGSMKYPGPDLIVSNKVRRLAIECKSTKKKKQYLEEYDIKQLKDFCNIFGAEPWFAVRFARKDWLFLGIEDLEKTENGYVIDVKTAERRGLLIDELIK